MRKYAERCRRVRKGVKRYRKVQKGAEGYRRGWKYIFEEKLNMLMISVLK